MIDCIVGQGSKALQVYQVDDTFCQGLGQVGNSGKSHSEISEYL